MITLPKPPSVNQLYKVACQGGYARFYMAAEGKAWFEEAGYKLKQQWKRKNPIDVPCELWVTLYTSRVTTQDCDNILKATQDLLQKMGVVTNDSLFYDLHASKRKCTKAEERIEIEIMGEGIS